MRLEEWVPYMGLRPTGDLGPLTIYTKANGKSVAYPKAPPEVPASLAQLQQRSRFRLIAYMWKHETEDLRNAWSLAAQRANLYCTGYNLYTYWILTYDEPTIRTVERISRLQLLPG